MIGCEDRMPCPQEKFDQNLEMAGNKPTENHAGFFFLVPLSSAQPTIWSYF
jgi:hypothetical protein